MGKVNLGELIAKAAVSNSDTGREQIEYIDLGHIDPDPNKFYSLEGLEELAANIQLCGLQQPIRVRPGAGGHVVVVSGHRRRAALELLAKEDPKWRSVPCIRERGEGSEALQELKLIYANSDTRKLTSPEMSRQARRVEELLYQLKEEGYDFPGRMRDHVAQACKVSSSKLARLKVIRDNLEPSWAPSYEKGELSETTAYALAQMPAEHQKVIFEGLKSKNTKIRWFYEYEAKNCGEKLAAIDKLICKRGARKDFPCSNVERKRKQAVCQSVHYSSTSCAKCCDKCENLAKCKNACPMLADKVKRLREDAKAQRRQEQLAKEEKERPVLEEIQAFWTRFGQAREAAGKSVKACYKAMEKYWVQADDEKVEALEKGTAKLNVNTNLPYGYSCYLGDVKRYIKVADLLGVSLDYLLCRTDEPNPAAPAVPPAEGWVPVQFVDGHEPPPRDGMYYCRFDCEGTILTQAVRWDSGLKSWQFGNGGARIDARCLGWYPLPEV